jgi:hypothetical protein
MGSSTRIIRALLLAAAAAVLATAAYQLREKHQEADLVRPRGPRSLPGSLRKK